MPFPPVPSTDIDWDHLDFKIREVRGHVESRYDAERQQWGEPELVKDPMIKIHGLAPALNYAQEAYEGLKAYRDPSGNINIFRPRKHAQRMIDSVAFVSIPSVPEEIFMKCVQLAVSLNACYVPPHYTSSCLYIRPLVFGSGPSLALTPQGEYMFCVYVQPISTYHGTNPLDALIMEDFDRAAPNGTGSAKIGGNYAPVMRWSEKAKSQGFGITLHLDSKNATDIDEFSTSGFLGLKIDDEGYTLVVPDSKSVILSITSDSCTTLAKHFGWKVEKRVIKYTELGSFSEVFAAGTAASLVPIRSITRTSMRTKFTYLQSDEPGICFTKLSNGLKEIQQGKAKDIFGWLEPVNDIKAFKSRAEPLVNGALEEYKSNGFSEKNHAIGIKN